MPAFGPGQTFLLGASEIEIECKVRDRRRWLPRAPFVDRHPTALSGFGGRRHPAYHRSANAFAIKRFAFIADDGEPARDKLVEIPEIAAAAVLLEPKHEEIVPAPVDARAGIALGEQPNVTPVIFGTIVIEQIDFSGFAAVCPTGRSRPIARSDHIGRESGR